MNGHLIVTGHIAFYNTHQSSLMMMCLSGIHGYLDPFRIYQCVYVLHQSFGTLSMMAMVVVVAMMTFIFIRRREYFQVSIQWTYVTIAYSQQSLNGNHFQMSSVSDSSHSVQATIP
jgi:hypothetical protein